ncbi:hypothetical protein Pfo_015840 [Paulownia fortunei]|nr:hypothetical protein Pfo_015840 [Paulownia fortunei]
MEVYNFPDQGLADMYLIQGTESNPQFTNQLEQFEAMYNEVAPDFFFDQGLYYPTATSYRYVSTGYESTSDWEDHHRICGLDGQDVQYTAATNESLPYVYYTPNYGYGQSPYNPYNPYIPGAMIGVDGSFVAPQQYYTFPSYENPISSPAYVPMVLQSRPDITTNGIANSLVDNAVSVSKIDGRVAKHNVSSRSPNFSQNAVGYMSSQRNSFARVSEGSRSNAGSGKQPFPSISSDSFTSRSSPQIIRARGPQGVEHSLNEKATSGGSQLKVAFPFANGLSDFESSGHARASVHKVSSKLLYSRVPDDAKVDHDVLSEQNQGPRMYKSKNQLVLKAYTTRAGNPDAQGNIVIYMDKYNRVDFPLVFINAKFFVIKSYSEDDVHKSIKYSVWSSTPNGNKKLNTAYEDAQKIAAGDSRGCPIFLFFSVNASGQFCGVAEMSGPVDLHKDMDFWQQDKWNGSFPVKWHIIKDVPNPNFRHIILENNENKPVTNSRDTQEISYKKGLEILQIFKHYTMKTSLLDDFMYYENRQRILQEERARLLVKSYENPCFVPMLDPPRKLQSLHDFPSIGDIKVTKHDVNNLTIVNNVKVPSDGQSNSSVKNPPPIGQVSLDSIVNNSTIVNGSGQVSADGVPTFANELKLSSLTVNLKEPESQCSLPDINASITANSELVKVVTIGSMPVKVNGAESSGFLTVGTIPLNPRALQCD